MAKLIYSAITSLECYVNGEGKAEPSSTVRTAGIPPAGRRPMIRG